jgi:hypothetical protein
MRKILLASVAAIPLLLIGMLSAPAQELKEKGASMSQSRAPSEAKEKSSGQSIDQNDHRAAKTSGAQDKTEGRTQPKGRDERQTAGQGEKGRAGENQANDVKSKAGDEAKADQGKAKDEAKSADQAKSKSADQAKAKDQAKGKDQNQASESAKNQIGESQNKSNKAAGTNDAQKEPPTTTGQSTRANDQNGRNQPNGRAEQSGSQNRVDAHGSVTLNDEQRTKVRETVLSGRDVPRVDRVNFEIDVGRVVPREVTIREVPSTLVEIYPEWRGDEYFVVNDEIVIVDRSRKVVARVPVGSSSASVQRRGTSSTNTSEDYSVEDIRRIQQVLIEKGFYHGTVDGKLGPETKEALITFQRREGIEPTGRIDERTVTSLGVSIRTEGQAGNREGENANRPSGSQGSRDVNDQKGGQNNPAGTDRKSGQNNPAGNEQRPSTSGQAGNPQQTPGSRNDQNKNSENHPSGQTQRPSTSGQGGNPSSTNQNNTPGQQGGATFTPAPNSSTSRPTGQDNKGETGDQRKQP